MRMAVLFVHFIAVLARLLGPGGVCSPVAESLLLKTSTPRESLPTTIAESIRLGPHPGALDASNSSAPAKPTFLFPDVCTLPQNANASIPATRLVRRLPVLCRSLIQSSRC
jgi:hypothetical protein